MSTSNVSPMFLILLCFYLISMCRALTFEQYEALQGQRFCGVVNPAGLKSLCKNFATINSITGYNEEAIVGECQGWGIYLERANGNAAPARQESLLRCNYDFPERWNGQVGAYTNVPGYYPALGRGIGQNDIMEYIYSGSAEKYVPVKNHPNFFN